MRREPVVTRAKWPHSATWATMGHDITAGHSPKDTIDHISHTRLSSEGVLSRFERDLASPCGGHDRYGYGGRRSHYKSKYYRGEPYGYMGNRRQSYWRGWTDGILEGSAYGYAFGSRYTSASYGGGGGGFYGGGIGQPYGGGIGQPYGGGYNQPYGGTGYSSGTYPYNSGTYNP